jgi:hypothetical protein
MRLVCRERRTGQQLTLMGVRAGDPSLSGLGYGPDLFADISDSWDAKELDMIYSDDVPYRHEWVMSAQHLLPHGTQMGDALPAVNLGEGRTVTALALSGSFSCALLNDGGVKCWGELGSHTFLLQQNILFPFWWDSSSSSFSSSFSSSDSSDSSDYSSSSSSSPDSSSSFSSSFSSSSFSSSSYAPWSELGWPLDFGAVPSRDIEFGAGALVRSICARQDAACVLLSNGAVKCWGVFPQSQIGSVISVSNNGTVYPVRAGAH